MIKCIAIDDEPLALQQITGYIEKTPYLYLQAQFDNALDAMVFIEQNEVDLMFIDINMPDLSGIDFVKSLKNPPGIIFSTAYSEYAIEGFMVDAIDYLLKPIGYDNFLRAAGKAKERLGTKLSKTSKIESNNGFLFIKSDYKIMRINLANIKYVESMREYVRIHLVNQSPVMSLLSMKKMEESLPYQNFMRVHRSYIVNLDRITTVERNRILFDEDVYIPVSEQYKEKFQEYIDKNFLI